MKRYLIIVAIAVGILQIDEAFGWMKTYGDSNYIAGNSVQQTSDGGYIFTGGPFDVTYLVKTNFVGDTLWTRTYGLLDARGQFVQQTRDGGYIIAAGSGIIKTDSLGDTLWTKDIGSGSSCVKQTSDEGYIITGGSDFGLLIAKTDSFGNLMWEKSYQGDSLRESGHYVEQTSDGGYIVIGCREQYNNPPYGSKEKIWLLKTNPNGDTVWTRIYGESGQWVRSQGWCVRQTSDGGYIATGTINGTPTLRMLWLLKTDANGNTIWTKTYGSLSIGYSVQQTTDGGYIITGMSWELGGCWLLKTNLNGDTLWTRTYSDGNSGHAVQQTSDGGYIIEGAAGGPCIFLLKTDSLGMSDTIGIGEGGYNLQDTEYKLAISPNPCIKTANIRCQANNPQSPVSLKIYDIAGKMMYTLVENGKGAGYNINFNKGELSSGIYFVELKSDNYKITKKLVFL